MQDSAPDGAAANRSFKTKGEALAFPRRSIAIVQSMKVEIRLLCWRARPAFTFEECSACCGRAQDEESFYSDGMSR